MGVRHFIGTVVEDFIENFEDNLGLGWKTFCWFLIPGLLFGAINLIFGVPFWFMVKWFAIILGWIVGIIIFIVLVIFVLAFGGWVLRHIGQFIHSRFIDNRA